jgi:bifunctional DNA-binding transcriptional regulator/antitoxin component of YhaV-PrlF toxin-antitoxin module
MNVILSYLWHMAKQTRTVRHVTSKGQVTLPASWRARTGSETVVFVERDSVLEVHPAEIVTGEDVLFDAVRDADGKGLPVTDLVRELKKDLSR